MSLFFCIECMSFVICHLCYEYYDMMHTEEKSCYFCLCSLRCSKYIYYFFWWFSIESFFIIHFHNALLMMKVYAFDPDFFINRNTDCICVIKCIKYGTKQLGAHVFIVFHLRSNHLGTT